MNLRAFFDEAVKLGAISDAQAQAALERYEALEDAKPPISQVARYGTIGAVATPAISAVGDAIAGKPILGGGGVKGMARGAAGRAFVGAMTSGAIPLVRSHFDRQAEMGTLKKYIRERVGPHLEHEGPPPAGKLAEPFQPVEKAAAGRLISRAVRAANVLLDDVDSRVIQQAQQEGLKTVAGRVGKGKEKDSAMTGATPSRSFDAGQYTVDLAKSAFATSEYSANLGGIHVPQKSFQPGFRAPSLRTVGQADPQQIKTGAGAPTRGNFMMASEVPAFRGGTLKSPIQTPPQRIVTKFASIPTTPMGRLAKAKSIGLPKVTAPPGPSIQQIAKPHGFGRPIAGATKTPG